MNYSGLILNDISAAPGLCVSFFTQGCPHRCKGCHNPETWDFNGGHTIDDEQKEIDNILNLINQNNIQRNLSILGGEPLHKNNINFVKKLLKQAKVEIDDRASSLLFERCNGDVCKLEREIAKLALFAEPINEKIIDKMVSRPLEDDVFELSNALLAKNHQKIMKIIDSIKR
mgnify:CR=1 FL=1